MSEADQSKASQPLLNVPLMEEEWLELLKGETALYPQTFQFNIENEQWKLMDENLVQLVESIGKVRRILGAKLAALRANEAIEQFLKEE